MLRVERVALTAEQYADYVISKRRGLFQSKEMRDAVSKVLSTKGYTHRKSRVTGQQLHPEYVTDYVGSYNTGFGNSDYQTFFSVLYEIREVY